MRLLLQVQLYPKRRLENRGKSKADLLAKLQSGFSPLSDWVSAISVGIQTSANDIYHFTKVRDNGFQPIGSLETIVDMEPDLLHPLIKGPDVKRYIEPQSSIWILVPYAISKDGAALILPDAIQRQFPKTWQYLKSQEVELRAREDNKMDRDDAWWGYNYPKNIDKQSVPRLMIAGTATGIRIAADPEGRFTQDDRRVFAIVPRTKADLFYLQGILNSPVAEFVFRRIARPKANGFYDIEQQFLAPLPIPRGTHDEMVEVGNGAKKLQQFHTARRDKVDLLQRRIESDQCSDDWRSEDWLWADVKSQSGWRVEAPASLSARERTAWAKDQYETRLTAHMDKIDAILAAGTKLTVGAGAGNVRFLAGGIPLVSVYVDERTGSFLAAQWRQIARTTNVTEKFQAKTLVRALLSLRKTDNAALRDQTARIDAEILDLETEIAVAEAEMNSLVYRLYGLTEDEIRLVEAG